MLVTTGGKDEEEGVGTGRGALLTTGGSDVRVTAGGAGS